MLDITSSCRACMKDNVNLIDLYDMVNFEENYYQLADILILCTSTTISKEDGLPQNLCDVCTKTLHTAYSFRKQVEKAHEEFKKLMQTEIKSEPPELHLKVENEHSYFDSFEDFAVDVDLPKVEDIDEGKYTCDKCNKIYLDEKRFLKHLQMHETPLRCSFCMKTYQNQTSLEKHLAKHYTMHTCIICKQTFETEHLLIEHRQVEHIEGNVKMEYEAQESLLQCPDCDLTFTKQRSLSMHRRRHKNKKVEFICDACGKVFGMKQQLKRHVVLHSDVKPYKCSKCPKTYARKDQLVHHMHSHKESKPYECSYCKKSFGQLCSLKDHIRSHTGETPYLCSECGKAFANSSNLRQHMMRHTGLKPYACNMCPKTFCTKGQMTSHMSTHTGEHPYKCEKCGATFTKQNSLKKHSFIHLGIRPFACDTCDMRVNIMEKKKRGTWDTNNLKLALDNVLKQNMTIREASERFRVPKSTLFDKVKLLKQGKEVEFVPVIGRFKKTFSEEYEQILEEHVKDLANRCMPLSKKEFLKLAYDLANTLKLPHRFNNEKKIAGKHFYDDYIRRHPDLSLRTAKSTSLMHAVGFNKTQVDLFFAHLQELKDKYYFRPSNIYNCNETDITTVQRHEKVIAKKNIRQVGKLTSAERGNSVTVMFCTSATGLFIPPFFIFPRQRINERLMINAFPESEAVAEPKGCMNNAIFLKWLLHFVKFSKPTKESPILLVLDGHSSHKTLDVINFCRDNHIFLISTPPHTTDKLQPLNRSFMKPFKNSYNERFGMWMQDNAGATITENDIAVLVSEAFKEVARHDIAEAGFRCSGIHPFNSNIFTDLDYLPSDVTNIPLDSSRLTNELEATNMVASNAVATNDEVLITIQQPEIVLSTIQEKIPASDSAAPTLQSVITLDVPLKVYRVESPQPSTSKASLQWPI